MPALLLTPAQRKEHRAAAHHLDPVVLIGAEGLTEAVLHEADLALRAHALIKVRAFSDDRQQRQAWLADLAEKLHAAPIQHIGKLLVLWRPRPAREKAPREDARPGPKVVKIVKYSKSPHHRPTVQKVRVLGNERVTPGGSVKKAKPRKAGLKRRLQSG